MCHVDQQPNGTTRDLWCTTASGLFPAPDFGRFIARHRFENILSSFCVADEESADKRDAWWTVRPLIDGFNANRRQTIFASWLIVVDELISAWRGTGMPHVSFIPRKPEPCGAEFKTLCDGVSGVMLALELQEGKSVMSAKQYHKDFGATTACTIRLLEHSGCSGAGRVLIGDSWFASVNTAVNARKIGTYFIGNVKTATRMFPKRALADECRLLDRGSVSVKSAQVDGNRLNAVGWKCGATKTSMTFVSTCGVTTPGTPARCSRQDLYGNDVSFEFPRPNLAEIYQDAAGAIDFHNRLRQGVLALEKSWVTQSWDFRIITTILGIVLVDTHLVAKHFCPKYHDANVLDIVGELTTELIHRGSPRSPLTRSLSPSAESPRETEPCRQGAYGRSTRTNKATGETYERQIQRRCVECKKETSFRCVTCDVGLCCEVNTGRNCYWLHLMKGQSGSHLRKRTRASFP
jgi:hypothetical protein